MQGKVSIENKVVKGINCISGKAEELAFYNGVVINRVETESIDDHLSFIGPGLIDLQINGVNGIDFNHPSLTVDDVVKATYYLLSKGVTTYLPTVITNSDENIQTIVHTIHQACLSDPLVNDCVWGIHLEGPFISPAEGAKGAHDEKYIKPPDWKLLNRFQQAAGGRIKMVTLAPEWEGACPFIEKCRANGMLVCIGHSLAGSEQIKQAINAGASLSTHLGNGVPLLLPRHPNIIWDQLAAEELYACIITDGIHIPDAFIKVVMKTKGKQTIVVSDATCFAGMPPGEYQIHIGGTVIMDENKRVSLKNNPGILAGAAKNLLENVEHLINSNISTLSEAWQMASLNVQQMLAKLVDATFENRNDDWVIFEVKGNTIHIERVIKKGRIVYQYN